MTKRMKMKRDNNDDDNGPQDKRNRRSEDQIRILIPSNIAGAIIGKGGQHIQKMRTQYKATVSVDDSQGPERTILIGADLESTLSIVTEMLKYFDVRDDEIDVRLLIHQSLAGCVIGKAGQKIKEIRDKIGCRILKVFSNTAPQSTDRVVQTVGKQEQVLDAIREVVTLTRETPIKGPVHNYNPINFDRMYADEYGGYGNGIGTTRPSRGGRGGGGGGGGNNNFRGGDRGGNRNDRSRSGGRGGGGDMNPFINPWANGGNNDGFGPNNGGFGGGNFGGNGGFGGGGGNFGNNGGGFGNGPNGGGFGGNNGGFGGGSFGNNGGGFGSNSMGGGNNGGFGGGGGGGGNFGNNGGVGGGMNSGNYGGGPNNMGGNGPMGGGNAGGGGGGFGMSSLNGSGGGGNNANNGNLPAGHDPKNSTQVTIPKDLAGAIIGKGGGRIRRIRNESGAYITIDEPLPGSTDRIITISGNPKQIQMAQYLLQQSVHENNNGGGGGGGRRNF